MTTSGITESRPLSVPELVIPAGSMEALDAALQCGADAVYLGGEVFSLRAKAHNFALPEMKVAVEKAHAAKRKVYVTVNAFVHEDGLNDASRFLEALNDITPDALIVADTGVFMMARRICPALPVHISTQANNVNHETFLFWYDLGVRRIVAARELSLKEIAQIKRAIPADMEIECFVHGAMCMAYSGRCHLSKYLTGRDANEGFCTQSCRWNYTVMEEKRPGQYLPVSEDLSGTQIFASEDLCMVGHIPELIAAGVDAFKIEGRTKTATYVKKVTEVYREAIDTCCTDSDAYAHAIPSYLAALEKGASRPFSTGFYFHAP